MTLSPELLSLLTAHETVEAITTAAGLIDSELPESFTPGNLDPWQRELYQHARQLRRLHKALSPVDGRLAAVGTPFKKAVPRKPAAREFTEFTP